MVENDWMRAMEVITASEKDSKMRLKRQQEEFVRAFQPFVGPLEEAVDRALEEYKFRRDRMRYVFG